MKEPKRESRKKEAALIGARLKSVRKNAGLSLQEIADKLNRDYHANTNKGMISKYENGIHEPSAGTLHCLSLVLGVSLDYLMCKTDEPDNAHSLSERNHSGFEIEVFNRYNPTDGGEIDHDAVELIPSVWLVGGHEYFGLRITGSEFAPRYYDGDIVIFERRGKVQRDRVGLVSIGDGDAFPCYIVRKRNGKSVIPLDRRLKELFFTTEQLAESDIHILGAAVQVRRME